MSGSETKSSLVLTFRLSDGTFIRKEVNSEDTILSVKQIIAPETNIPVESVVLVYGGKILKENYSVSYYGLKSDRTIHVAKAASNATISQSPAKPPPNPLDSLKSSPFMKMLLSNPNFIRSMMYSSPQMKKMMKEHPELRHMLNDDEFLKTTFDMASNPELRKELLRNSDRAMSNLEAIPGGFNKLSQLYNSMEPLGVKDDSPSTDLDNLRFAERLNVITPPDGRINTMALPNPWEPERNPTTSARPHSAPGATFDNMFSLFGSPNSMPPDFLNWPRTPPPNLFNFDFATNNPSGNINSFGPIPNQTIPQPPNVTDINMNNRNSGASTLTRPNQNIQSENISLFPVSNQPVSTSTGPSSTSDDDFRYNTQLTDLEQMGFSNRNANKRALLLSGGNLNSAVEWLLKQESLGNA